MSRCLIKARWVAPVSGPPIQNGFVATVDEFITEVGAGGPADHDAIDFGDAVLLPGFINAHTHLALTSLEGRVPFTGSFVDWIKSLRAASTELEDGAALARSVQ